ncbi:MAG: hypothetical protein RR055_08035, partial [Oscillospiraceae bacterium]
LAITILSIALALFLISKLLKAVSQKEPAVIRRQCKHLLFAAALGGISFALYVILNVLAERPEAPLWLIVLKTLNSVWPFLIVGGSTSFLFKKTADKIEEAAHFGT